MKKIQIPYITERIWGITPPSNGIMYVVDHDEVHQIKITDELKVSILSEEPYSFCDSLQNCLGIPKGEEILEGNGNNIKYSFDSTQDTVCVKLTLENTKEKIIFPILSGDWFAASFSVCGCYLLLAEPYSFELYEL